MDQPEAGLAVTGTEITIAIVVGTVVIGLTIVHIADAVKSVKLAKSGLKENRDGSISRL